MKHTTRPPQIELTHQRLEHASYLAHAGSLTVTGQIKLPSSHIDLTLSEALVLGLLQQGVKTYFTVLGHGCTEVGEVLRIYQQAGLIKVFSLHNEIEASHAAAALRWVTGEKAAVLTSIGPGALQALAASITPASDGIGVWYLFGDETTEDEGFNMQQIPRHEQGQFLKIASAMGPAYSLHTSLALPTALRRGLTRVDHPYRPGPFYLLLPMNTQAAWLPSFNLDELPVTSTLQIGAAEGDYIQAAEWIKTAIKPVIKVGGGGRFAGPELTQLVKLSGAVLVHTPIATGCISYQDSHNMGVGGSKGSLCGNYAMENADLLIAIGTRSVCQSDCSRSGYPQVRRVININADVEDALHYGNTLALLGDIRRTLVRMIQELDPPPTPKVDWLNACAKQKAAWQAHKLRRIQSPLLADEYWNGPVLTQPAAIKIATDWAKTLGVPCFFDAGDVQANGFQIVEDDRPGQTFTESGASYMGFAVSALLATCASSQPFYALALTGDGSFTMNPQILIDGAEHGVHGCILLMDNGRMAAITGLQEAQYGAGFATWNTLKVDFQTWARGVPGILAMDGGRTPEALQNALNQAGQYKGLTLIHLPVYYGSNELGGMGVFGRWNVGNWSEDVQHLRHEIGL
jgi:3D-(3,5/4)-trihydroxycyclohexane-1,2-dione acylhydrolase (decyclizing)